jgi:hypothetical protein
MSTRLFKAISEKGTHQIGTLNTSWAKQVPNGAKLTTANVENYTLVEMDGRDADGNKQCKQLSAKANKAYLVTTVEEEQLQNIGGIQETYTDFFNEVGEMIRLTRLEVGIRFETSAFSFNAGTSVAIKGLVAHFDVATKKYILSTSGTPHADYASSSAQFEVVDEDTDFGYALEVPTIRLECTKG